MKIVAGILPQIAVFFLSVIVLSGCTGQPSLIPEGEIDDVPAYGDALSSSSIADARTLVPVLASDSASSQVCGLLFNGLVKYDKDLNIVGDLAESWQIQQEGLAIVFHLRRGVRWHDGKPFMARDVAFTYKKLIDPNVKTPYSGDFEKVKSLEVIDDYTIKLTYPEPFAPALASWTMNIIPEHILKDEDLNTTPFSRHPVGTGPYKFKEWKTQELIVLESNPDYFEGRPYIDTYIFRVIPDAATMFLELQNLGIDYMGLSSLQYVRQTNTAFFKKYYQKFRYPSFSFTYLGLNLNDPKFKDKRVRQAINCAVDKQEIIQGIVLGLGTACTGPFAPRSWAYNSEVISAPYNPDKSRELLRQAGWVKNEKGYLQKDGKVFEFTIITNQGNEERKRAAEIIQKRLDNIGIKVKIRVVEWSTFISEFINKRRFEAVLLGWSLSQDPDIYDIWHSSKTKEGEFNFIGFKNEAVDELLVEGRRTFDQEKRKEIYHKIHSIIYEEQPYIFLYTPDSLPIVSRRIRGIKVEAVGISYNFIKWYVVRGQQKYQMH
ncbi:MAG: peptide-binding protein [Candidatus Omnitrophota bacterium]